jgi:hypothetical protein
MKFADVIFLWVKETGNFLRKITGCEKIKSYRTELLKLKL